MANRWSTSTTRQQPRNRRPLLRQKSRYYTETNANIHRGIHFLSEQATAQYEGVREKIARFIGAGSPESIIFTRNATEAINLVAYSWARKFLKEGDEIVITAFEHHSNLVPWQLTAKAIGAKLRYIPLTPEGEVDMASAEKIITRKTKLVAVTAMSNVLGTIVPVKDVMTLARAVGAKVLLDGAQSIPHLPFTLSEVACDFLVFSAHKMIGPTGVGVLYGKPDLLNVWIRFSAAAT